MRRINVTGKSLLSVLSKMSDIDRMDYDVSVVQERDRVELVLLDKPLNVRWL